MAGRRIAKVVDKSAPGCGAECLWPGNLGRARSTQSQEKKLRRSKGRDGDAVVGAFREPDCSSSGVYPRHRDSPSPLTGRKTDRLRIWGVRSSNLFGRASNFNALSNG